MSRPDLADQLRALALEYMGADWEHQGTDIAATLFRLLETGEVCVLQDHHPETQAEYDRVFDAYLRPIYVARTKESV